MVERAVELRRNPITVLDFIEGPNVFLEITYVTNPGAAWSMFSDYPNALTALAAIALWLFSSLESSWNCILSKPNGYLVEFVEELWETLLTAFRTPAEVVDFIDVYLPYFDYDYPVFNIADSALCIGAIACGIVGFFDSRKILGIYTGMTCATLSPIAIKRIITQHWKFVRVFFPTLLLR